MPKYSHALFIGAKIIFHIFVQNQKSRIDFQYEHNKSVQIQCLFYWIKQKPLLSL